MSVRLTRRGKRVRAILLGCSVVAVLYTATQLHYTEEGYCWGSFIQCYEGEGKR